MSGIFVTGAAGFLGTALCKHLSASGREFWAGQHRTPCSYGRTVDLDLTDQDSVERALATTQPDIIIHTAYAKEPTLMEDVIAQGTRRLAQSAANARFIHISTDWVFDGKNGPYSEDDPPCPCAPYGRMKLEAEGHVQAVCLDAVIVRTSLISGTDPPAPRWQAEQERLRRGEPVAFYDNEIRNPIHVDDLAQAILEAAHSDYRGLLHIAGPETLSRFEELRRFVHWRGLDESLIAANHSDGKDRPLNSCLRIDRFQKVFRTALRGCSEFWPVP